MCVKCPWWRRPPWLIGCGTVGDWKKDTKPHPCDTGTDTGNLPTRNLCSGRAFEDYIKELEQALDTAKENCEHSAKTRPNDPPLLPGGPIF